MQSTCLTHCVANYVIKNCSCKDTYMPGENKIYLKQQASSPFPPFLFWAFVCKTVRPIVYRTVVCLSCLPCLSVTLVYCGQTVGCIKMKLGVQVGFGPGHIVLDGDPVSPQKGTQSPTFGP